MDSLDESQLGDIPTRPMRVKILYSFDAENKINCLARFSNTKDIPAVAIDDQSQVGVIQLQHCIESIVTASPEILSELENGDFIIYAYDYSEYDTPLVGQGRLSAILASSTAALPNQNTPMITGRVCKNLPALFSNGVKETLEVKLRLTPVSKPSSKELARKTDNLRSMSPATSAGFDPNAWNASMQQQSNDLLNLESFSCGGDNNSNAALLEDIFSLDPDIGLGSRGALETCGVGVSSSSPANTAFATNPAFSGQSYSAPGSRSGTPMNAPDLNARNDMLRHQSFSGNPSGNLEQSRPDSRASVRSEVNASYHHTQPTATEHAHSTSQNLAEDFFNEDQQSRKRVKVTQTDWHGRSSFGAKSADLRVNAATASSMHMFRPIAKRPSAPGSNLEPPPRVPTPVPQRRRLPGQQMQQQSSGRSMLHRASTLDSDFTSDADMSDTMMSSPEGSSPNNSITAEGTPVDIPSSPPIIPGYSCVPPSSPTLPALPKPKTVDSGYMSEQSMNSSNVMQSLEDDETQFVDTSRLPGAPQYYTEHDRQESIIKMERSSAESVSPRFLETHQTSDMCAQMDNVCMEIPGDMNQLPQRVLLNLPPGRRNQGVNAAKPIIARKPTVADLPIAIQEQAARSEPQQSRRNSLALPPRLVQAQPLQTQISTSTLPDKQKRRPLQRSQTNVTMSEAGSPAPSDSESRPRGNARSGSAAPRRKVIEQRLKESLAKGEMPEYCSHCGAIETPTWRKLYVKYVDGKPSALDEVEGEGETIGVHTLESDPNTGEVTKFVIRKMMKRTKDCQPGASFKAVLVCNPCGLWFNKTREMRPADKWHKTGARRRRKQRADDDIATDGIEPESEAFFTDQYNPDDLVDGVQPGSTGTGVRKYEYQTNTALSQHERTASALTSTTRRASSDSEIGKAPSRSHSARAVQSSPSQGSQETPIELDLTPNPTRRLLFPSPRQAGEIKSLERVDRAPRKFARATSESVEKSTSPNKNIASPEETDFNVFEAFTHGKENIAPGEAADLSYLFDETPFKTPQRKSASKKTPLSDHLSTPAQSSRKRDAMTTSQNAANNADMAGADFMTSPSSSRYFLRSTPSRLERTPGRRSPGSKNRATAHDMTPFSRHLAEMLNNSTSANEAAFTSPTRQYDFSDLPSFNTPGREMNWKEFDEILSSEFANYEETADLPGAIIHDEQV